MTEIHKNSSLKPYNTFGIDAKAKEFAEVRSFEEFLTLLPAIREQKTLFLGMGSNILLTQDYDGLVVLNSIKGRKIIEKTDEKVLVEVLSGENWHEFVLWTLDQGAYGLENLSLIPGKVGASPIQNIGAYGEEIKNWCVSVTAIELATGELRTFSNRECEFGYRESVFKKALKGQYFIYSLLFELDTAQSHQLNMNYGDIKKVLEDKDITNPTPKDISNAVIEIRSSKLPDFHQLGNAGSFFKNPIVKEELYQKLALEYPTMPHYSTDEGVKIPAGWLIEQCGFKGYREGNVGSYASQALVIVNYGGATGKEVYDYSTQIIDKVRKTFGVELEREVNVV